MSNERARTALIGDIHGNFVALDAVLSDSERRGVDGVVCLGDLAAGGPQQREAIERLRDLGFAAVRGNTDEWLLGGMPGDPETDDDDRNLRLLDEWAA